MIVDGGKYQVCEDFPVLFDKIVMESSDVPVSMLEKSALRLMYQLAMSVKHLPGLVAEMGVWKGGTLQIIASVLDNSVVYGFDSWEGLPEPQPQDIVSPDFSQSTCAKGWGRISIPSERFVAFGDRVKLIKGWFRDTLPSVSSEEFRFVHVDCDRYQSVKECFEFFDTRMVPGGFMIFHDYRYAGTPGAKTAVDEYLERCAAKKVYKPGMFILQY